MQRLKSPVASLWPRVLAGAFFLFLTSGFFFAYPALKPIFINEGLYSDLCHEPPVNTTRAMIPRLGAYPWFEMDYLSLVSAVSSKFGGQIRPKNMTAVPLCEKQNLRLNFLGQTTPAGANGGAIIIGFLVDAFGVYPRSLMVVNSIIWGAGCIMFALAPKIKRVDMFIPSSLALVLCGAVMNMNLMRLRGYARSEREGSMIVAILNATWDLSTLVALIFNLIYFKTKISMMEMFLYFSTVLVVLLPYCVVHVPFSFEFVGKGEEREALVASKEEEEEVAEQVLSRTTRLRNYARAYFQGLYQSFGLELICIYFLLATGIYTQTFYLSTVTEQLMNITSNPHTIATQITVLSVFLPVIGTAGAVLLGYVKGFFADRPYVSFLILVGLNITWSITSLIPNSNLQYVTFVMFVLWRVALFIVVLDHILAVYPAQSSFTVFCVGLSISGLTAFSAGGLNAYVEHRLDGQYLKVNIVLYILNNISTILLTLVSIWGHIRKRRAARAATQAETTIQ